MAISLGMLRKQKLGHSWECKWLTRGGVTLVKGEEEKEGLGRRSLGLQCTSDCLSQPNRELGEKAIC